MKYKDYELKHNPAKIEISSKTNVKSAGIFNGSSVVENISTAPITVKCTGELFGKEGIECCDRLQYLLRQSSSGWLFAPGLSPIKAFLTSFSYTKGADKNSISYNMEFTEDCNTSSGFAELDYTVCRENENVFDIAYRCNVPVHRIIRLNEFLSPFDIKQGDKVVLR